MEQIKNKDLKDEIETGYEEINNFNDFLKIEQDYLINQIELDKGIGKNNLTKENVFLLFFSVITNIPLIIIGKPGTAKSLSCQLINKSMRGKILKYIFSAIPTNYPNLFWRLRINSTRRCGKTIRKSENKLEILKKI